MLHFSCHDIMTDDLRAHNEPFLLSVETVRIVANAVPQGGIRSSVPIELKVAKIFIAFGGTYVTMSNRWKVNHV
jgi:hypothetical protein